MSVAVPFSILYATVIALAGYLVAADSGRRGMWELWLSVLVFVVVPLLLIISISNLIIGLTASVVVWGLYFLVSNLMRKIRPTTPLAPIEALKVKYTNSQATLNEPGACRWLLVCHHF